MQGRYLVVTDSHSDRGFDERKSYYYLKNAKKAVEEYLADGWEGAAIYDIISGKWHGFYGDFRKRINFRKQMKIVFNQKEVLLWMKREIRN